MIYNRHRRIILCAIGIAIFHVHAMGFPIVTNEDLVYRTNSLPILIHTSCRFKTSYLSGRKTALGYGSFLSFSFGKMATNINECVSIGMDGLLPCLTEQRKMRKDEYRGFCHMTFFFNRECRLLYKVEVEKVFAPEAGAKDRMATITGIISDCEDWYKLKLARMESTNGRVVYLCADDVFEIRMELSGMKDGRRRLLLSVMNKKVRDGKTDEPSKSLPPVFDADKDMEISI